MVWIAFEAEQRIDDAEQQIEDKHLWSLFWVASGNDDRSTASVLVWVAIRAGFSQ
jgi:hypothetical protein